MGMALVNFTCDFKVHYWRIEPGNMGSTTACIAGFYNFHGGYYTRMHVSFHENMKGLVVILIGKI